MAYVAWETVVRRFRKIVISETIYMGMTVHAVQAVIVRLPARCCTIILMVVGLCMADLTYTIVSCIIISKAVCSCK